MRKIAICALCLLLWNCNIAHAEIIPINIVVEIVDDTPQVPGKGKAPMRIPRTYQDGYKLILSSFYPECFINIVQDDEVVYSSTIPAGVTEFDLPLYLSGECSIQLICERFCFYGQIIL